MRLLLASAVLAAAIVVGSSSATANPPPPTCQGNPHFCDTQITVESEPPGENCEFGGVKITITRTPPVLTRTDENPPPPEPEVEVFYVCNGADGAPGPPGPPGPDGIDGITLPGLGQSQDQSVDIDIDLGNRHCRSERRNVRLTLPPRMRSLDSVRVKVDRERALSHDVVRSKFVRVNMDGKRCGAHIVQAGTRSVARTIRLWTVLGPKGVHKRVIVA